MPIASARISNELHEKIQIESALAGISVSDFIRSAIDNKVNGRIQENGHSLSLFSTALNTGFETFSEPKIAVNSRFRAKNNCIQKRGSSIEAV